MIFEINYYAQTPYLLDDLVWYSILYAINMEYILPFGWEHHGWEKHRLLRRVEARSFVLCKRDRERERELGDDEGFVRSVGGLGDAQWRRCARAAPLLVFFFPPPLSLFSERSLFCGHRRCNPKAFFFQFFWSSLEIFIFDFFPVSEVVGCFSRGAGEMTSMAGQPQFRYTQQPSKVLHVRNLPWECSEEELIELCKPFGKVVNTKVNVGANQNQAFIEFVSATPAQNSSSSSSFVSSL